MKRFNQQCKRVKDLRWQIVRWTKYIESYEDVDRKYSKRIAYYTKQYEVALKRLKQM
jgi:hypothetical protein